MALTIDAVTTAVEGLKRQGERVAQSAQSINQAFAAAQNAMAADSVDISGNAAVVPAVEDAVRGAVLAPEGDITSALVDILSAKTAYAANAKVLSVSKDLDDALMKAMDREV